MVVWSGGLRWGRLGAGVGQRDRRDRGWRAGPAGRRLGVVAARRLWPRSLLQPPVANADQPAPVDLANQQQHRP